ncbi:hypothetical protein [Sporanaerobacter sp. PP17-6a]|uniref:hypothetical protein n=1 Tax=Sporanaerobacter sp. PP17-6a TaxID=1891289 RepID=UPI0008A01957|nr:hypothetical protein [Sporanaerobacter sp. PP17-6a]SCL87240.1 hypothetical protein PP176A_1261 [Sporanaerobacter sp. PP17-6a]
MNRIIKQKLNLKEVSSEDLNAALEKVGKDMVYNYFLFGNDVTYEIFLEDLKKRLNLTK